MRDRRIAQAAARSDWVLGFQDECGWSRWAQPDLFAWTDADPLRWTPPGKVKGDGPAALACYGIYRQDTGGMRLRFVDGRPASQVTEDFLGWACGVFAGEGKKVFVLVWDNAAWHVSRRARRWIETHDRRVRRTQMGCRIRVCGLPVKAPWRNPIEPKWMHGKRAIVEPDRKLTADEVKDRVCSHFGCPPNEPLKQDVT